MSDDRITVGVTHEILIDGERSWIKYEITTGLIGREIPEDARKRASVQLNEGVMNLIAESVETVRGSTE